MRHAHLHLVDRPWDFEIDPATFVLGLDGFLTVFGHIDKSDEALEKAHKAMDADGDGKVSPDELRKYLTDNYPQISEPQIKAMLLVADINKDGNIDPEEFKAVVRAGPDAQPGTLAIAASGLIAIMWGGVLLQRRISRELALLDEHGTDGVGSRPCGGIGGSTTLGAPLLNSNEKHPTGAITRPP